MSPELGQLRVGVALVTVLLLAVLMVDMGQVWALSVTPNTPIAGYPFTVNSGAVIPEAINVYAGSGCSGNLLFAGQVPAGGSLSIPGQPAGQYSTNTDFEPQCLNFTIIPASIAGLTSSKGGNSASVMEIRLKLYGHLKL